MSEQLLRDIFDFLKEVRPEYGTPQIIILGGSQTIAGGQYKTQNSDYDTLVIFPHTERAESYTFSSKDNRRSYDLILRDDATLAYDIKNAFQDGKGTVLHIAALGSPIYDPDNRANILQQTLKNLHDQGPNTLHFQDAEKELALLRSNLYDATDNKIFTANILAICNSIARTALRFSGEWTSNGKIAGRYLKEKNPDLCATIQIAFADAVAYRTIEPLAEIIHSTLPKLFTPSSRNIAAPFERPLFDNHPNDLGIATTSARTNLDAMASYLKNRNSIALDAAATWAHIKSENLLKPLSQERYKNRPEEYFFALGRAISGAADLNAALYFKKPNDLSMTTKINYLFEMTPNFDHEIELAISGNSQGLTAIFKSALKRINHAPLAHLYRPSPLDFRADPSILVCDNRHS